jgi:hypothetical protein
MARLHFSQFNPSGSLVVTGSISIDGLGTLADTGSNESIDLGDDDF